MSQPFFSILIATYNRPTYIGKCLASVFENEFGDFEVLISDDHSKNIEEIKSAIQPYLSRSNVRFVYQPRNLGFDENYNYLIENGQGKFLILVDDDDRLKPGALKKIKEYIDKKPGYDLYGFGYEVIDENDKFYCSYCPPISFEISLEKPKFVKNLFFSDVLPFQIFHSCALAFKKEIGTQIKRKKAASIGADMVFLYEAINSGRKMFIIPEVLFSYRKVLANNKKGYFNWTGPAATNIMARRDILYNILCQGNWRFYISNLVSSAAFRKRYLFDPIIFNRQMIPEAINSLNLQKEHLRELMSHYGRGIYLFHRFRIRKEQLFDQFKLFGFEGVFGMFLTFLQRFFYRLKIKS